MHTKTGKPASAGNAMAQEHDADRLDDLEWSFVLRYIQSGFRSAAGAYRAVRPGCTAASARVGGHRLLTRPRVARLIDRARTITGRPRRTPAHTLTTASDATMTTVTMDTAQPLRVQAIRDLWFRNRRVRAGEVLELEEAEQFRRSQMRWIRADVATDERA